MKIWTRKFRFHNWKRFNFLLTLHICSDGFICFLFHPPPVYTTYIDKELKVLIASKYANTMNDSPQKLLAEIEHVQIVPL